MCQNEISSVSTTLKNIMSASITIAESVFELAKRHDLLDSQEFIDWQDKLNAISIKYK